MRRYFENLIYERVDRLSVDAKRWRDVNHLVIDGASAFDNPTRRGGRVDYRESFISSLGVSVDDIRVEPATAFILTPFNPRFEKQYELISNVCRQMGIKAIRGDEEHIISSILPHVVEKMLSSSIVIANIDGRNPNVFYELGIAHALNKDVILIASSIKDVPFDLQSQRIVLWRDETDLYKGLSNSIAKLYVHREMGA